MRQPSSLRVPISTHAPRTGSDGHITLELKNETFQPTLPARGATSANSTGKKQQNYFNPRSPHGERRRNSGSRACSHLISTHAPRTGSDLSTEILHGDKTISTHAPRTGSDARH